MESLASQLQDLQSQIKRDASSAKLRTHLFQLLCVMGHWQRALEQLQLCAQLDAKALPMAQMYREAIRCEMFRGEVFAGKRTPQVMGKPPEWIGLLIEALRHDGSGQASTAAAMRAQAMDAAEPAACSVDGASCEWLMDGDSRLGPVCEVFTNGQYYWLPFESCAGIQIDPPTDMRDLVWSSAVVLLPNEGRIPALIPTRYPEPAQLDPESADQLRQSRATHWMENAPGVWFGAGQRVWMSDVGEHAILDTRTISMLSPPSATADGASGPA
jgi:type VI secretion system protein ImpE